MSSIIKNKSGNNVYLYESTSFRNKEGKVRNKRRIVGKVHPETGEYIFKPEYLEEKGINTFGSSNHDKRIYTVNDVKSSNVKEYGVFLLLDEISKQVGLSETLEQIFPASHKEILNLAFYIVSSGEPALYCEDWLYRSEHYPSKELSSQRVSELLLSITPGERNAFFEKWSSYRLENEYIALDTTSISTYSHQINDAEWGYNRDKEKLPQINVCMLLGEKSRLPIFQVTYSGSLKDVSTLKQTLRLSSNLNLENISVVMDKGFASLKNIKGMLVKKSGMRFLIALPFNMTFPKRQIASESKDIDCIQNTILVGHDVLRGVTKKRKFYGHDVYSHIYLNVDMATQAKDKLFSKVQRVIDRVKEDSTIIESDTEVKKYLIVRKSSKSTEGYTINIREEVIQKELAHSGWLVLVSNHIEHARDAIMLYREKDAVEKGFQYMKNCLDLARLRVHSDNAMQNRIFIGFIALILTAHIHKIMSDKSLYAKWTMKKMIKALARLKVHYIKNDRIITPITKEQRLIFDAFNINYEL